MPCPAANHLAVIYALDQKGRLGLLYRVFYKSRYYPFEGTCQKLVRANSKKEIRSNWHCIMLTDEYRITKIEEVKDRA